MVLSSSHPHSAVVNGQQRRRFQHNSTPKKQPGVGACRRGALRAIHRISTPEKFGVVHELFDKKQKGRCYKSYIADSNSARRINAFEPHIDGYPISASPIWKKRPMYTGGVTSHPPRFLGIAHPTTEGQTRFSTTSRAPRLRFPSVRLLSAGESPGSGVTQG